MDSSVGKLSAEEMFTTDTVSDTNDTKESEAMLLRIVYLMIPPPTLTEIVTVNGLM